MQIKVKRKGTKFIIYGFVGRRCVGRAILTICVYDVQTAVVTDLFVPPEFRGQGYGRELTRAAIGQAWAFSIINRVVIQDGSEFGQTRKIAERLNFAPMTHPDQKMWELKRGE